MQEKLYTYVDLRFHSHMFTVNDYSSLRDFFRNMMNEERYALEDIEDSDIYEGCKRQWEEIVGEWTEKCENEFQDALDRYVRDLH